MGQLRMFENYIGIDYSGAGSAVKRNKARQVFMASGTDKLTKVQTGVGVNWNWNRKEIAHWCLEQLKNNDPIIIGIDHAFSFPDSYMKRYDISSWDHFLDDFHIHWPTEQDNISVEYFRENNERTGNSDEEAE